MSFLEWILFCAYWQTHKKYEFWLKTVADDPYEAFVFCSSDLMTSSVKLSIMRLAEMKDDDIALKSFLTQMEKAFNIKSERFVDECFEGVRLGQKEPWYPLYQEFLRRRKEGKWQAI